MNLNLMTFDQIVGVMGAQVQGAASNFGITLSLKQGSALLAFIRSVAGIYLWLQWLIMRVLSAALLTTASGSDVDSFCEQFGCARLPGTASSGLIVLSRYSFVSAAIVPVGSIVKTTDGIQSFLIVGDESNPYWTASAASAPNGAFVIPAGTANCTVTCENQAVGLSGNIIAGAIGLIASVIPGVDTVTNPNSFSNGVDAETDAAFKARFALFLPALARGTQVAVVSAVLGVAQNLSCAVLNSVAEIGGAPAFGYAVIAVDDGSGATPSTTLNAVAAAATGQSIVPLGATVSVMQAVVVSAEIVVTISCATAAIKTSVQPIVQAAITSFVNSLPVASESSMGSGPIGVLPFNMIAKVAFDASSSVQNVTGVTLNGGAQDIGGRPGTVVRVSSVMVY